MRHNHPAAGVPAAQPGQRQVLSQSLALGPTSPTGRDSNAGAHELTGEVSSLGVTPLLLTVKQVAALLQLGLTRTYRMCEAGIIPAVKIDGTWRVPYSALVAWVEAQVEGRR